MSANYFVNILWTSKILSITQSKKAQIISYDMIYAWLHTDFRYIVLNWPDYIWVIRLCTPGYPSDTCLNRFLSSIRQMLKQDPADPNNPKGTDVFMFAAASTESPITYFSRKTIIAPSNNFLQSLTIFPTAMALISVPSLTPFNLWKASSATTIALTVRKLSNPTFTFPNFMPVVCEIARTSASAGSIITSAITSRLMTKATVITLDDDSPFFYFVAQINILECICNIARQCNCANLCCRFDTFEHVMIFLSVKKRLFFLWNNFTIKIVFRGLSFPDFSVIIQKDYLYVRFPTSISGQSLTKFES